ncbi:MAG TPA: D-alanine--D-alanine ligase [Polyangia bacterium]|nr:D-alanine--D-alanine ligase [Polyangia bacterium]
MKRPRELKMMRGRRIGVLMGGLSSERDQSIRTGDAVHASLVERGYDAVKVFVDSDLDLLLRAERIDIAFLALHGRYGEDGCVQGMLELFGIPYTGSSVLASALAMDKLKAKELFRLHNVPTPPYYVHVRGEGAAGEQHGSFGFPSVVKPRAEGSSLGVRRVDEVDELESAVDEALRFDDHALVERFVDGAEVHVALLGGRPLGAVEVDRAGRLFDFAARAANVMPLYAPPRLSVERLRGAMTLAMRAARALECNGLCEVDLVISDRGNEQVLEVDTQPSLAPHSLVPKIAHAAGWSFDDLVEAMLHEAQLHTANRATGARRMRQTEGYAGPERRTQQPTSEPH